MIAGNWKTSKIDDRRTTSRAATELTEAAKGKFRELGIDDEQLATFREAFIMFDKDGSGEISKVELRDLMKSLGQDPTEMELEEMMKEVDEDGSGEIEYEEFVTLMARKMRGQDGKGEDWQEAFNVFDKDGDGYISVQELLAVMCNLGEDLTEQDVLEMFAELKPQDKGKIDFREFTNVMVNGIDVDGGESPKKKAAEKKKPEVVEEGDEEGASVASDAVR